MRTRKTTLPTSALPVLQVTPPMVPRRCRRCRRGICCRHHQRRRRRQGRRRSTHKSANRYSAEPKTSSCHRGGCIFILERGRTTKAPPWVHPITSCSTSTCPISRLLACRRVLRASFAKLPSASNSSHYLHRPPAAGAVCPGMGNLPPTPPDPVPAIATTMYAISSSTNSVSSLSLPIISWYDALTWDPTLGRVKGSSY